MHVIYARPAKLTYHQGATADFIMAYDADFRPIFYGYNADQLIGTPENNTLYYIVIDICYFDPTDPDATRIIYEEYMFPLKIKNPF